MRILKLVIMLFSLVGIAPGVVAGKDPNPFEEKLPFKNGAISYTISGLENGTETLYVDDYGSKSATYHKTVTTMMGMTMENNSIEIIDPDWVYNFDLVEGTGNKSRNPMMYMQEEFDKLTADEKEQVMKNREQMGMSVMAGMGGTIEQNAIEILGYKCDRVDAMGTTVYSIHDSTIALKTESNVMGMKMDMVATDIDKGKVDDKFFTHPPGIEVMHDEEADAMSLQMAQQTMEWLKDPEAASKAPQMGVINQDPMQHVSPEDQEMMKQAGQKMQELKGVLGN